MPEETDSYYGATDSPAAPPDPSAKSAESDDEKDPGTDTALLPKSLFPGEPPAIGDVCSFKVEHVWEDEIEVSYVKDGEGAEKSPGGPSAMDSATAGFDQMASPAATAE